MSHHSPESTVTPSTHDPGFETRTALFRTAVAHTWPVILGLTVIGAVLGATAGVAAREPHVATSAILLSPLDGNAFYPSTRGEQLINLNTEAQVLRSDAVAKTIPGRKGAAVEELLDGVSVVVPVNTQILQISYTDPDPSVAVSRAQGFADSYLAFREARATDSVNTRAAGIKEEVARYQKDLADLSSRLPRTAAGSPEASLLLTQIQSISTQVSQLNAQMGDISTTPLYPGQVITPARLQDGSFLNLPLLLTVAGGLAGLALALAVALVRSRPRSGKVIRSAAEIKAFNVPTIASHHGHDGSPAPLFSKNPPPAVAGLNRLNANVLDFTRLHRSNIILLSTAGNDAAQPLSAVSVAWSLAEAGIKTLVVDTTGRLVMPPLVRADHPGLADLGNEHLAVEDTLVSLAPTLQVMGSGSRVAGSAQHRITPRLIGLIGSLAHRADVVLVVTGPMLSPNTQLLATTFKSVVIEIAYGSTRMADLNGSVEVCRELSVHLLGAVVLEPAKTHPAKPFSGNLITGSKRNGNGAEPPSAAKVPVASSSASSRGQ
jgi:Mrp family chromosome partitioning ATPase